jgi:hypothetical protein
LTFSARHPATISSSHEVLEARVSIRSDIPPSSISAQTGNIKLAQKLLGHSNLTTTADIYTHTSEESEREAAEAIEREIFGKITLALEHASEPNPHGGVLSDWPGTAEGKRTAYNLVPRAGCPGRRKVFGYAASPHSLNDPKSLYQSPTGTSGFVSTHSRS